MEEKLQPKKAAPCKCFPGNEKEKEVSTDTISLDGSWGVGGRWVVINLVLECRWVNVASQHKRPEQKEKATQLPSPPFGGLMRELLAGKAY